MEIFRELYFLINGFSIRIFAHPRAVFWRKTFSLDTLLPIIYQHFPRTGRNPPPRNRRWMRSGKTE
jgi:hypothetical protein